MLRRSLSLVGGVLLASVVCNRQSTRGNCRGVRAAQADTDDRSQHPQQFVVQDLRPDQRSLKIQTRREMIDRLTAAEPEEFDIVVVGGGATGCGIAFDAASRGLNVCLVERDDFSSGTSSRSTKLIHGGVRYLEMAFKRFDFKQLALVFEALQERAVFLKNAPHSTHSLPVLTPCYSWFEVAYYWTGLKVYDAVARLGAARTFGLAAFKPRKTAGETGLYPSYFLSASEALRVFPTLAARGEHGALCGCVVYYDGQFNDARMNVALALSAMTEGAVVLNHCEVTGLSTDGAGRVVGVECREHVGGATFGVRGRVVINATGPFVDRLREQEHGASDAHQQQAFVPIVRPSSGVHVILPDFCSPDNMGFIVPRTRDGRVLFMLPWEGHTIVGTTDNQAPVTALPRPRADEVAYILDTLSQYLTVKIRAKDVQSCFSGIRPLAVDPRSVVAGADVGTAKLSRNHVLHVGPGGMVTITGGKWTTYRRMAEETVDSALVQAAANNTPLRAAPCQTRSRLVLGADGYDAALFTRIAQMGDCFDTAIAKYMAHNYGSVSIALAEFAVERRLTQRLVPHLPFFEAECVWAAQREHACTVIDVLARRTRLAFLDVEAADAVVPRVAELMAEALDWTPAHTAQQVAEARQFLTTFRASRFNVAEQKIE